MCGGNDKLFIATLYNLLLATDLCNQLFFIVALINLGHTWLFHKGFSTVLFSANEHNAVTSSHRSQIRHTFLVKNEGIVKITKANS